MFQGERDGRRWVAPILLALHAAALVTPAIVMARGIGAATFGSSSVLIFAIALVPVYLLFLVDLTWLRSDRIRKAGVPATGLEGTGTLAWGFSAAVMTFLFLNPAIMLLYLYLRPRLVAKVRAAATGEPDKLPTRSGVFQGIVFIAFAVAWWGASMLVNSESMRRFLAG